MATAHPPRKPGERGPSRRYGGGGYRGGGGPRFVFLQIFCLYHFLCCAMSFEIQLILLLVRLSEISNLCS